MEADINIMRQIAMILLLAFPVFVIILAIGSEITSKSDHQSSDEKRKLERANVLNNPKTPSHYEKALSKHWATKRYGK